MKLDASTGSLSFVALIILVALLKALLIRWLIRRWPKNKKAVTPVSAESKRDSLPFISASVIALSITFGVLLLLSVNSQPGSPPSRAFSFLAAVVAAINLIGVLLLVFGVPAYKFTMDLKEAHEGFEEKVKALVLQIQGLKETVEELKAQIPTVSPAQQLPIPRKASVRRKQQPQAHPRRNSSKDSKADVGK